MFKVARLLGVCVWVVLGFFVAQVIVVFVVDALVGIGWISKGELTTPLAELLLLAIGYLLALALIIVLPRLITGKQFIKGLTEQLGITKSPRPLSILWSILGYGVYTVLTILFSVIVQSVWHGFNSSQAQSVGFQGLSGSAQYIMAFVALVVIPPLVEEMLFRGYLFGRLRKNLGFWLSMFITSALFGFVHLQWNVGIDVFALSLVLCFLREKTGTIWAGVGLHMIKNGVAYTVLFLQPDILKHFL